MVILGLFLLVLFYTNVAYITNIYKSQKRYINIHIYKHSFNKIEFNVYII